MGQTLITGMAPTPAQHTPEPAHALAFSEGGTFALAAEVAQRSIEADAAREWGDPHMADAKIWRNGALVLAPRPNFVVRQSVGRWVQQNSDFWANGGSRTQLLAQWKAIPMVKAVLASRG